MIENSKKFNLNIDFELIYYKNFSKNDHLFKQFLIKNALSFHNTSFTIYEEEIKKFLSLSHSETFFAFLNKFFFKKIYLKYNIVSEEEYSLVGISPILNFSHFRNTYTITLDNTFFNIILGKENFNQKISLKILLSFSTSSIQYIYFLIEKNKTVSFTLEEFKEIFKLKNHYSRFFDLEKKIILPTIAEIENTTSLKITYEKIKKSNSKNSKIEQIKFSTLDTNLFEILLRKITKYSNNLPLIKKLLYKYSKLYSLEYLEKNIEYTFLHYSDNFDSNLIKAIKYNYIENKFKHEIKNFLKLYTIVSSIHQHFTTFEEFKSTLVHEIQKNNITQLQLRLNLLKFNFNNQIINNSSYSTPYKEMDKNNFYFYEDSQWIIYGEFNGKFNSNIIFFTKK